jgi:hypothetical protein
MIPAPHSHAGGRYLTRSDFISRLPWHDRMQAYDDFDAAVSHWKMAGWYLRHKLPGWKLDHMMELRRARRAWGHYASAVRKAKSWRAAA